jgi:hypothetical protein
MPERSGMRCGRAKENNVILIPIAVLWVVFTMFVTLAAEARGRDAAVWFFLSLFLCPLLVAPMLALFPIKARAELG